MEEAIDWYMKKQVERTIANLQQHNIGGFYAPDLAALHALVTTLVPEASLVAVGDSVTLEQTGLLNLFRSGRYRFLDKQKPGITQVEKKALYRQSFGADAFFASANAVTETGEIYNVDGNGSRVAAMLYGPDQVILVVGTNKIVQDEEAAKLRIRQYAAPLDAKRLGKKTPCAVTGVCVDCQSAERICNSFVGIKRQFLKERIKVIFVGASLGY